MSELFKQIKIGETTYDVGANAENVAFNEDISVKEQIQDNIDSIKNKADQSSIGNGTITINQGGVKKGSFSVNQSGNQTINLDAGGSGGGVAAIDAVIENSLTVNGYVVEGEGHDLSSGSALWINVDIDNVLPISYTEKYQSEQNIVFDETVYKYCLVFNAGKAELKAALTCKYSSYQYFKGELQVQQYTNVPVLINLSYDCTDAIAVYHNDDGIYDWLNEALLYGIYFNQACSAESSLLNLPNIHIQGKYSNLNEESIKYAHVVGGGTSESDRKNIHTLDWDGNVYFAGDIDFGVNEPLEEEVSIFVSGGWTDTDTTIAGVNYKYMCYYPVPSGALSPQLVKEKYYEGYFTLNNGDIYPMIVYYEGQDNGTITVLPILQLLLVISLILKWYQQ